MDLESVLYAEDQFVSVLKQTRSYLKGQNAIWKMMENNEIKMVDLKSRFKDVFGILERIDSYWDHLREFFKVNKLWFYLYEFTVIFFYNRRLSRKEMEEVQILRSFKRASNFHLNSECDLCVDLKPALNIFYILSD